MCFTYFCLVCCVFYLELSDVDWCVLFVVVAAAMPPKRSQTQPTGENQLLAAMKAMQAELRSLRQSRAAQGTTSAAQGATGQGAHGAGQDGQGANARVSGVSLIQWIGMKLDSFDGSGTPVEAADWLSYVEDKMEVFDVLTPDRFRYGTQLLKGEAQIWWKGVQSAHTAAHGPLSWPEFVRQFERRFYPATFLDQMKIDLNNYTQEKKSVAEYEVGFNQIVRFVPHVARDEVEKARQFRQGLKPSIRHVLGAFPVVDFCTMVEQALGVEMQQVYTFDMQKSSGGDQTRNHGDKNSNSGAQFIRRAVPNAIILTMVVQVSLVLKEGVILNIVLFLNLGWEWCASDVAMRIAVLSAGGPASASFVVRITRMLFVGRIPMVSCDGRQ